MVPVGRGHRRLLPVEDDLPALPGAHEVEAALEVREGHPVRDDRGYVEPALDHGGHLVPGVVHLPSVDAADREHVEDDLVPVDGGLRGHDPQERDPPAVRHVVDHVVKGLGAARHLEPHVKSLLHPELGLDLGEVLAGDVHHARGAHLRCERQAVGVHVGDDHLACPAVLGDRGGHAADGTRAGDDHVLADQVELERGVGRVAERIEAREDVQRDRRVHGHGVCRRDAQVLGKRAVAVHAHALRVLAQVTPARQAVAAHPADDVALAVHQVALLEALHQAPDLLDDSYELVADDHRGLDRALGPVVPVVDVDVRPADRGLLDADKDVARAGKGHRSLNELEAGPRPCLGDRSHRRGSHGGVRGAYAETAPKQYRTG